MIFTDDARQCSKAKGASGGEVKPINIEVHNLHSQYGSSINEEYYNYAFRTYKEISGHKLHIIAEVKLIESDAQVLAEAIKKLEQSVATAITAFPQKNRREFTAIKYYIFSGGESRVGGRKGGQWYFPKGNNISPRFDNSIVIRSAKDYLKYPEARAAQTAFHELSHAYYSYHRKDIYWTANKAFKNARKTKLYLNVKKKKWASSEKSLRDDISARIFCGAFEDLLP